MKRFTVLSNMFYNAQTEEQKTESAYIIIETVVEFYKYGLMETINEMCRKMWNMEKQSIFDLAEQYSRSEEEERPEIEHAIAEAVLAQYNSFWKALEIFCFEAKPNLDSLAQKLCCEMLEEERKHVGLSIVKEVLNLHKVGFWTAIENFCYARWVRGNENLTENKSMLIDNWFSKMWVPCGDDIWITRIGPNTYFALEFLNSEGVSCVCYIYQIDLKNYTKQQLENYLSNVVDNPQKYNSTEFDQKIVESIVKATDYSQAFDLCISDDHDRIRSWLKKYEFYEEDCF